MPNAKGGKKFKKGKKQTFHQKALIYKDPKEEKEHGKVIRAMGNGRFEIQCFDGKTYGYHCWKHEKTSMGK